MANKTSTYYLILSSFLNLLRQDSVIGTAVRIVAITTTTALIFTTTSLLFLAAMLLLSFLFQYGYKTHKKRIRPVVTSPPLPPGPVPWPIIGNLPELYWNKPSYQWILGFMKKMNTEIVCIRLGNVHIIPVISPEIAVEFLKKQDAIFASRPHTMATEYSSRGGLALTVAPLGDQYNKMRRLITSEVISSARLNWLLQKSLEEADNLTFYLYNQCRKAGGGVVDIRLAVRQYAGNVMRKLMFNKRYFGEGKKDGGPGFEEEEHVEAVIECACLHYSFALSDYAPCLRIFDIEGHGKLVKKALKVINKYHDPIIDERFRRHRSDDGFSTNKEPEDLLDVLILAKEANGKPLLSKEEIKAQTADFFFALIDNTSNAVEWAMAEMINQPDILRKAVEEIDMVVGRDRLVQESDFPQLNYVKSCAREALRLHPVFPFNLPHVSISDATVAGYFIPKGSHVLVSRLGLGRNPRVWDEPLKFQPERHLKDGDVKLTEPDLRFLSFSTGRRGCIGHSLGSPIIIMLLARILQGFSWSVPAGDQFKIDLTEMTGSLFLAKRLHTHAKPRLQWDCYPTPTSYY